MRDELTKLLERWQAKTGRPMPQDILRQSLPVIRRAVEMTERGDHVFVEPAMAHRETVSEESTIPDWDTHDNKLGS